VRRVHPLLVVAAVAATLLPAASADAQTKTATCIPGTSSPSCKWWTAKVTFIADGDTVKVRVDNDPSHRERRVRFIGINAMELHRYSKYPDRRVGECHGLEATALVERYIKRSGWRVWLAAQHASSESGGRLRRSVWVHSGGAWLDLAKIVMQQGQALWLPNGDEWAHNLEYHQIAQQVANAGLNLWNTRYC
jgi:endonuclease YncB( thermonuclease family)